jgi:hypothetical protein
MTNYRAWPHISELKTPRSTALPENGLLMAKGCFGALEPSAILIRTVAATIYPGRSENYRCSLAKIFKQVAITGIGFLQRGGPRKAYDSGLGLFGGGAVFLGNCAGFFNHPGLEDQKG